MTHTSDVEILTAQNSSSTRRLVICSCPAGAAMLSAPDAYAVAALLRALAACNGDLERPDTLLNIAHTLAAAAGTPAALGAIALRLDAAAHACR